MKFKRLENEVSSSSNMKQSDSPKELKETRATDKANHRSVVSFLENRERIFLGQCGSFFYVSPNTNGGRVAKWVARISRRPVYIQARSEKRSLQRRSAFSGIVGSPKIPLLPDH